MEEKETELLKNIVKLNKIKQKLLNEMAILELQYRKQTPEFHEKVQNYQLTYEAYKKIVKRTYDIDKNNWIELLIEINHYPLGMELPNILIPESRLIPIIRTMIDLGLPLTKFYNKKQTKSNDQITYILNMLGLVKTEEFEEEDKTEIINIFINNDVYNTAMYKLEKDNATLLELFSRKELITIKYNLILLMPELEAEYTKRNFKDMAYLHLTDDLTLKCYGLNLKNYQSILDAVCINTVNSMLNTIKTRNKTDKEDLIPNIYYLFINSFISLISDQELKKMFISEIKENIKIDNNQDCSKVLSYLKTKLN